MARPSIRARVADGFRDPLRRSVLPLLMAFLGLSGIARAATDAGVSPESRPVFHVSLNTATEAATADQSLILLVFSASWCAPCRQLHETTLQSPEFLEQGGAVHVVEVDVDAEPATARGFGVSAVPALFLLTADGKIVARESGFQHTAELLLFLKEGRNRARAGEWEGTVPQSRTREFETKAAANELGTNDIARLIQILGDPSPADRAVAARILAARRDAVVSPLIQAIADPYLGVRIGASELLQQLAPDQQVDPWQSPEDLRATAARLTEWWARTGKLGPAAPKLPADPSADSSIRTALDAIRSDDPSRRTAAMVTLVRYDKVSLTAVREAIKRNERGGDQRTVTLLEDVRWSILVPDSLERRADGIRTALARGKSNERQDAAVRLGKLGRDALPALAELVNEADPLVAESALRALSGIGGVDSIPAMAALLNAADSNLRMTAAQALGHSKKPEAVPPLLTVCDDPNEIVACAALAGLEEINSAGRFKASESDEVQKAVKTALADSRWRVRATAAETAGKMSLRSLAGNLKALLQDSDGFVVKQALTALGIIGGAPDLDELSRIAARIPSLRADIIERMLQGNAADALARVSELFGAGSIDEQAGILAALAQHAESINATDAAWRPLISRGTTSPDPRLRRSAAELLQSRSAKLAGEFLPVLLTDDSEDIRIQAAGVVINLLKAKSGTTVPAARMLQLGQDYPVPPPPMPSVATPEQLLEWHGLLEQHAGTTPALPVAIALLATGDGTSDLLVLERSLGALDSRASEKLDAAAVELLVSKLPWPEAEPVLSRMTRIPPLYAMAAAQSPRAEQGVATFLLNPVRLKSVLESTASADTPATLRVLVQSSERSWSLLAPSTNSGQIALELLDSANPAFRAAAVFRLGLDEFTGMDSILKAATDGDRWVRLAALQSLSRRIKDRAILEERAGALLTDPDPEVATMAAVILLEPEVQAAGGVQFGTQVFRYESVYGGGYSSTSSSNPDRPLAPLARKPAFLPAVRDRLEHASTNTPLLAIYALLLSQYGDLTGLDRLLQSPQTFDEGAGESVEEILLASIALSRDPKYLPAVKKLLENREDEYELRKGLQAIKGMSGAEARQLRLDINKRIRQPGTALIID